MFYKKYKLKTTEEDKFTYSLLVHDLNNLKELNDSEHKVVSSFAYPKFSVVLATINFCLVVKNSCKKDFKN